MINIRDLHITSDILPLFDYTCNDFSRNILAGLFNAPLPSVDAILHRQQVIKGMLQNWKILEPYSYARGDMMEVYSFCHEAGHLGQSSRLELMLSGKKRLQLQTRLIQFITFMHRLYNQYFSVLQIAAYPPDFEKRSNTSFSSSGVSTCINRRS